MSPPSQVDAGQGTVSHPTGIEKSFIDQHFPEEGLLLLSRFSRVLLCATP